MSQVRVSAHRLALLARQLLAGYPGRLGAIALVGGLWRLVLLDRQPLWRDEAFTAIVAQHPVGAMLSEVSHDSAPPLHYLGEHLVAQMDASPWALRLISTAAGTILILMVAALARRMRDQAAGLWAAAVAAVLPTTVLASRDARMYALAGTLTLAAVLLLLRATEKPSLWRWLSYAVVVAAALWTQYFAIFAVAAALPTVAWWARPPRRTVLAGGLASGAAVLSLAPWLLAARAQFEHAQTPFWVEPVGLKTVSGTVVQFFSGPPIDPGIPWKIPLQVLQGVAIGCGALGMLALILRRNRLTASQRRAAMLCAGVGGGGIGLLLVVSLWHPLLEARYASVVWTPLFALIGLGLSLLPRRAATWLLAGLLLPGVGLSLAITHPETPQLLPAIESRLGPHDLVDASPAQYLLLLYDGGPAVRRGLHVVSGDVPWFWGTAAYPPGAVLASLPQELVRDRGRILYVGEPEDGMPSLPAGYTASEQLCTVRVCLTVFGPRGSAGP